MDKTGKRDYGTKEKQDYVLPSNPKNNDNLQM